MVKGVQVDSYVDESDETCPLCVEEFDLSDKNFKPCPCGYQVCQFCFNNIKNNMNGLCPACRRPYNDETIEWKVVSPEEFKADVAAQARKKAAARQKEAERKQVESLNRKHLAGLRVLQKNLVYVIGMDISNDENALETLRGPHHFGQYGEIIKIVASKAKEGYAGHQSTGIYVTFLRKEDASTCITAVDGTLHEGRVLRAQYGTTKYCSAFLRNERCTNRSCMFLHETGEDSDSFSRQDLSSLNAASSQRPAPSSGIASLSKSSHITASQAQPPLAIAPVQSSNFQTTKAEPMSRSDSGDGSALPTTANWAKNPQTVQSRRSSQAASRATPSPKTTNAIPVQQRGPLASNRLAERSLSGTGKDARWKEIKEKDEAAAQAAYRESLHPAKRLLHDAIIDMQDGFKNWKYELDRKSFDAATLKLIDTAPPLIDPNGGVKWYLRKKREEEGKKKQEAEKIEPPFAATAAADDEENMASGSLQLGGEPDNSDDQFLSHAGNSRRQTPFGGVFSAEPQPFDRQVSLTGDLTNLGFGGRSLTPQQQRNISLLKSGGQMESGLDQPQRVSATNTSQHHSQLSNPFQSQNQQLSALSRHGRHASRYNFANDTGTASTIVKPSTNAQLLAQQSAMMPHPQTKNFGAAQPGIHSNFYSGVQGPPPGLKASGTPPISGGGMFAQGHGFASAIGGGANFGGNIGGKSNTEDNVRDLMRNRMGGGSTLAGDGGKREFQLPPSQFLPMSFVHNSPFALPSTFQGPPRDVSYSTQDVRFAYAKPKKPGKKRTQANPTPFRGGGAVDLPDPSILQARMQHPSAGQGPYGNSSNQGGYNSHGVMYGGGFGGRW